VPWLAALLLLWLPLLLLLLLLLDGAVLSRSHCSCLSADAAAEQREASGACHNMPHYTAILAQQMLLRTSCRCTKMQSALQDISHKPPQMHFANTCKDHTLQSTSTA
jgi:hypothetical protein